MSPAGDRRRRRRRKIIGAAGAAVMLATAVLTTTVNYWPGADSTLSGSALFRRVWLDADRDLGALPNRSSWCAGSDHCWVFQQSSGDATDYGDVGGWHLTPAGSPRAGLLTSLPQRDATGWVDYTSELAVWGDGGTTTTYAESSVALSATSLVSVTVVFRAAPGGYANPTLVSHRSTGAGNPGWMVRMNSTTRLEGIVDSGPTAAVLYGGAGSTDAAWHCATMVLDARTASAGKVYFDGADDTGINDLSSAAGFMSTASLQVLGWANLATYATTHGVARVRIDDGEALTLADHQTLCGDLWQAPAGGPSDNKPAASDDTWTQTGGATCWPTSDASAVCVPGGMVPYTYDGTGIDWSPERDQINRVTYSTAIDGSNWTTAATPIITTGQVAPDGSSTATKLVLSSTDKIYLAAGGYTADATLYPRTWVRCSAGTLLITNPATITRGRWDIDCSQLGGQWTLIYSASQSAVTEVAAWQATAGGVGGMGYYGSGSVTVTVWGATVTEEPGSRRMVIPTAASAVSSGDVAWVISNPSGDYYRSGDTVLQSLTTHAGACWVADATELQLAGSAGSECTGGWYSLEVRR